MLLKNRNASNSIFLNPWNSLSLSHFNSYSQILFCYVYTMLSEYSTENIARGWNEYYFWDI